MVKKCSFCRKEIAADPAFEVCQSCGYKIWGEKMFKAIVENMEKAREVGDLYQGSVTNASLSKEYGKKAA